MVSANQDPGTLRSVALDRLDVIRRELSLLSRDLSDVLQVEDRDDAALEGLARGLMWQRAIMAEHLDPEFSDPASNILLFIYAAGRDAVCTTGACCEAARVPRTTALRWIAILESRGLVRSVINSADKRKTSISFSEAGRTAMRNCMKAIAGASSNGLM